MYEVRKQLLSLDESHSMAELRVRSGSKPTNFQATCSHHFLSEPVMKHQNNDTEMDDYGS